MDNTQADWIERAVDCAAAFLFAAGAAFCASRLGMGIAGAGGAALVGFCACFALLRAVAVEAQTFAVDIAVADFSSALDELLLTDVEQVPPHPPAGELLLDDALAEPDSDSRVVQLFDPASMPTPGELRARIDRHLRNEGWSAPPLDASQALHEALAELRRTIR